MPRVQTDAVQEPTPAWMAWPSSEFNPALKPANRLNPESGEQGDMGADASCVASQSVARNVKWDSPNACLGERSDPRRVSWEEREGSDGCTIMRRQCRPQRTAGPHKKSAAVSSSTMFMRGEASNARSSGHCSLDAAGPLLEPYLSCLRSIRGA